LEADLLGYGSDPNGWGGLGKVMLTREGVAEAIGEL
jgi:hypothetical protein